MDRHPGWRTPQLAEQLETDKEYFLLAGMLIQQGGVVNASDCPMGGLESGGAATVCGMEAAQEVVDEWQNQFNSEIIQVANQTGVPAQLMKNILAGNRSFGPGSTSGFMKPVSDT